MRKRFWSAFLILPLAVAGGLAYAIFHGQQPQPASTQGYVCPITGEELPCALCCPLNGQGYICPATGEELPCPLCCPLQGDLAAACCDQATCCDQANGKCTRCVEPKEVKPADNPPAARPCCGGAGK